MHGRHQDCRVGAGRGLAAGRSAKEPPWAPPERSAGVATPSPLWITVFRASLGPTTLDPLRQGPGAARGGTRVSGPAGARDRAWGGTPAAPAPAPRAGPGTPRVPRPPPPARPEWKEATEVPRRPRAAPGVSKRRGLLASASRFTFEPSLTFRPRTVGAPPPPLTSPPASVSSSPAGRDGPSPEALLSGAGPESRRAGPPFSSSPHTRAPPRAGAGILDAPPRLGTGAGPRARDDDPRPRR